MQKCIFTKIRKRKMKLIIKRQILIDLVSVINYRLDECNISLNQIITINHLQQIICNKSLYLAIQKILKINNHQLLNQQKIRKLFFLYINTNYPFMVAIFTQLKRLFAWLRLFIALFILHIFFYHYLFHKYQLIPAHFDRFYNVLSNSTSHLHSSDPSILQILNSSLFKNTFNLNFEHQSYSKYPSNHIFKNFSLQNQTQTKPYSIYSTFKNINFAPYYIPTNKKKVHQYLFNFYNWYRIQFRFVDQLFQSFLEFRLVQKRKGSHHIIEKIPFSLPQNFFPLSNFHNFKEFNIKFNSLGIKLNVSQITLPSLYNDNFNDGLQSERFFVLSQNKTQITSRDYQKFGSFKTITQFNFEFTRKDYEIKANLTHVIRHNQCQVRDNEFMIRKKCMGGYGKGKLNFFYFQRENLAQKQSSYKGSWQKQTFNLDNSRVRTTFIGERWKERQLNNIAQKNGGIGKMEGSQQQKKVFFQVEADFIGFSKKEYYQKNDKIEKERWVGMTLYQEYSFTDHLSQSPFQANRQPSSLYFYINGNIHPILQINYQFISQIDTLQQGQVIKFSNYNSSKSIYKNHETIKSGVKNMQAKQTQYNIELSNNIKDKTPNFDIQFMIFDFTCLREDNLFDKKQTFYIDGYWSGWIDQSSLFDDEEQKEYFNKTQQFGFVSFYNITGTIKITQNLM